MRRTLINMTLHGGSYVITVEKGAIKRVGEYFNLKRRVIIITDDGVPREYSEAVACQCDKAYIYVLPQGEKSKSFENYGKILSFMCREGITRGDCVVAVGGGVCGDLAGFCAASYMRGIDFYNVPTTVLSQVDSSIGGKTAIDLDGYKNVVGAFYQPKGVIIDTELLETLSERRKADGMCEALKMAAVYDNALFELFEKSTREEIFGVLSEKIITSALMIKKSVVEKDEYESGLRRILNFGHTVAHALESCGDFEGYFHGECVAMGMLPMCEGETRERIRAELTKLGLPTTPFGEKERVLSAIAHDKKLYGEIISVVYCGKIGTYEIRNVRLSDFRLELSEYFEGNI